MNTIRTRKFPKISIVTPSFNQAQYLEATLDSVLSQGYPNLEYIVMDGGSTDGSVDIIRRHEKHLAYWQSRKDGGQSAAINAGFARATGDIFCWINSDDQLAPGALHVVVDALSSAEPNWLIGACDLVDAHGKPFARRDPPANVREALMTWWDTWFAQQSTFWTRSMWKAAGPLDVRQRYVMDYDLWLRMYQVRPPEVVSRVLASYRFHEAALCSQADEGFLLREQLRTLHRRYRCVRAEPHEFRSALMTASQKRFQLAELSGSAGRFQDAFKHARKAARFHSAVVFRADFLRQTIHWIVRGIFQRNPLRAAWRASSSSIPSQKELSKVVFSLPNGVEVGGVTTWSFGMTQRLRDKGVQARLIEHPRQGEVARKSALPNVVQCMGPPAPLGTLGNIHLYEANYVEQAPCIFVPNWSWGTYAAATLARIRYPYKVRILGFAHTDEPHYYELLMNYAPAIDRFVAVSETIAGKLKALLPFRASDVVTRPYAVQVPHMLDRVWAPSQRPLRLLYAGRFEHRQKRVLDLAYLCRLLDDAQVPFELELVGEGSARADLESAIALLPITVRSRIHFSGRVHHEMMQELWRKADVCVLTSEYEGTSIAMLEAMAQGCIPVVTRVSGAREVIQDGVNGLTVEVGDMPAMARAIEQLSARREQLAEMGRAAHATVLQHHSFDDYVKWFESLCAEVWRGPVRTWPRDIALPLPGEQLSPLAFVRREVGLRTRLRNVFNRLHA